MTPVATVTERKPGVWFARVFVPPTADAPGRQVGKVFHGTKKAVRMAVTAWEAEVRGHAPSAVGATVTDLLTMWLEARAHDWQPLTARDHRSRVRFITEDLGTVCLVDLDPLRVDAWLAQMRRRGVGQGAIRGRFSTFKAACSWGVSRRLLRSNPIADAAPRLAVVRRSTTPEPDQVVALLQAAAEEDTRAALGLRIAAVTGARQAEVVALAGTT